MLQLSNSRNTAAKHGLAHKPVQVLVSLRVLSSFCILIDSVWAECCLTLGWWYFSPFSSRSNSSGPENQKKRRGRAPISQSGRPMWQHKCVRHNQAMGAVTIYTNFLVIRYLSEHPPYYALWTLLQCPGLLRLMLHHSNKRTKDYKAVLSLSQYL